MGKSRDPLLQKGLFGYSACMGEVGGGPGCVEGVLFYHSIFFPDSYCNVDTQCNLFNILPVFKKLYNAMQCNACNTANQESNQHVHLLLCL